MKKPKVDMSGVAAANEANAAANRAATNLERNFRADLSTNNVANVIPGGGADAAAPVETNKRRNWQPSKVASQLMQGMGEEQKIVPGGMRGMMQMFRTPGAFGTIAEPKRQGMRLGRRSSSLGVNV